MTVHARATRLWGKLFLLNHGANVSAMTFTGAAHKEVIIEYVKRGFDITSAAIRPGNNLSKNIAKT